jgi:hypothetical protein
MKHGRSGKPAKRQRITRTQLEEDLLGAVLDKPEYRSSEDEDFVPTSGSRAADPRGTPRRAAAAAAEAAEAEDDEPLSQRKRRLLKARASRTPVAEHPAQPQAPSAHLPVEVIERILRFASASNAVPIVATGKCCLSQLPWDRAMYSAVPS